MIFLHKLLWKSGKVNEKGDDVRRDVGKHEAHDIKPLSQGSTITVETLGSGINACNII